MKEYRVTINVKIAEVEKELVATPKGEQGIGEKVIAIQVTERTGSGDSPKAALQEVMENGIDAYLQGMREAEDNVLIPGREGN